MTLRCALLCCLVSAALFAETVVKNSAPFSFPLISGISKERQVSGIPVTFAHKTLRSARGAIAFSWSIPSAAKQGVISVFRIDGSRVALLKINQPRGSMQWTPAADGIYLATIRYGTHKLDSRMIICK